MELWLFIQYDSSFFSWWSSKLYVNKNNTIKYENEFKVYMRESVLLLLFLKYNNN